VLKVEDIHTYYGASHILQGISLAIEPGEVVAVIGRNGVGKTTLLATVMGHTTLHGGAINLHGRNIARLKPHRRSWAGLGYVPQEREIFPSLSLRENLEVALRPGTWTIDAVYALFPRLAERQNNRGNQLSGGEQQMLAVGRALMTNPRLLILDEATEGLAPLIRAEIWRCVERLKASGLAILLIDKNVGMLTRVADRHFLIERGRIAWSGVSSELAAAPDIQHRYLGV
jgi:branched-chain amino acid transport system ATP-binding protein